MITAEYKNSLKEIPIEGLNNLFIQACSTGNLEFVQFLLTSPELTENPDIYYKDGWAFCMACENSQIEIMHYLLTSPELTNHIDIHMENDRALLYISRYDHINQNLEVLDYVLTSPLLKEHANIYVRDNHFFQTMVFNNYTNALHYLIFDYEIEQTEGIKIIIETFPEVQKMFELRELKEKLETETFSTDIKPSFKI